MHVCQPCVCSIPSVQNFACVSHPPNLSTSVCRAANSTAVMAVSVLASTPHFSKSLDVELGFLPRLRATDAVLHTSACTFPGCDCEHKRCDRTSASYHNSPGDPSLVRVTYTVRNEGITFLNRCCPGLQTVCMILTSRVDLILVSSKLANHAICCAQILLLCCAVQIPRTVCEAVEPQAAE